MNKVILKSTKESPALISGFFRTLNKFTKDEPFSFEPAYLEVREDICFKESWLRLGSIALKPAQEKEIDPVECAIRYGFYEWEMKPFDELEADAFRVMGINLNDHKADDKAKDNTRRALDSVIDAAMRLCFLFPRFDANLISCMPFRRPTTVVADTNAISKGGVDFLIRFLYPMCRLRVPSIVPMEILNKTDSYLSKRRKALAKEPAPNHRPSILLDHVCSQAGQRALLRFELHAGIEIERTPIHSGPLRNAFAADKDGFGNDLNLSAPVRSYCDRLILETVKEHINHVSPGHLVLLMTGDEGLARMALAEGIQPLFFHAGRPPELFGQVLTGTRFHPFTGEVFHIPLQNLLWELAVTFGNARLVPEDESKSFEVRAMDTELSWQPFHAKDDLLLVRYEGFDPQGPAKVGSPAVRVPELQFADGTIKKSELQVVAPPRQSAPKKPKSSAREAGEVSSSLKPTTVYRFDLGVLLEFIPVLLRKRSVSTTAQGTPLEGKQTRTLEKYIGFLTAGRFITKTKREIRPTDALQSLYEALIRRDLTTAAQYFCQVPSIDSFLRDLQAKRRFELDTQAPESKRPSSTYIQIAEICGLALHIYQDALYATSFNPSIEKFVEMGLEAYEKIKKGEDYVLTGLWLETLARDCGIHPINARDRLSEARAAGIIERYTQGSTPDTRFERHTFAMMRAEDGTLRLEKVCLYHGDFIIPGKSSVSIRLERKQP